MEVILEHEEFALEKALNGDESKVEAEAEPLLLSEFCRFGIGWMPGLSLET